MSLLFIAVATCLALLILSVVLCWWCCNRKSSSIPGSYYLEPAAVIEQRSAALLTETGKQEDCEDEVDLGEYDKDAFDVCVMGAGVAGLLQVRHLQLECPGLRICLIDPLSAERNESDETLHKIGESTVFTSCTFLVRDLGLQDYLIANQLPKHGLFYHFPRDINKTDVLADYYSTMSLTLPEVPSHQIDRPKFERDLLQMILKTSAISGNKGHVRYIQGKVKKITFVDDDVADESPAVYVHGQRASAIEVLPLATSESKRVVVRATHLVDAAGRAFLIPRRKALLVKEPVDLMDIDNAAVWLQVNDFDADLLIGDVARGQTLASWFYATNHFCGSGHWLWVIPIKDREEKLSLSIGVSFHKQKYQLSQFNTQEKFLAFLKANHTLLYNVVLSGKIGLFRTLPRLAHRTTQVYDAPARWYVLGEAAVNIDPFYSTGIAIVSYQVQQITAIVRAKTAAHRAVRVSSSTQNAAAFALDKEANDLIVAYNTQAVALAQSFFLLIARHWNHLGNASIMSWRILLETCVPAGMAGYFAKGYLDPLVCRFAPIAVANRTWLFTGIYDLFDELLEKKINVGFQDYNEPNRIPLFKLPGYSGAVPLDFLSIDDNLRGGKYTYHSANIAKSDAVGNLYLACALVTLVWRGFGWRGLLRQPVYERIGFLLASAFRSFKAGLLYSWKHRHENTNRRYRERERDFQTYDMSQQHVPWEVLSGV